MPDSWLCIACWASEFADDWEEAEADMQAGEETIGPV